MVKVTTDLAHRLAIECEKPPCYTTVAKRHGVDRRTVKAYVEEKKDSRQPLAEAHQAAQKPHQSSGASGGSRPAYQR
jgi:hypothetical protein